jgi:hypothetical protein
MLPVSVVAAVPAQRAVARCRSTPLSCVPIDSAGWAMASRQLNVGDPVPLALVLVRRMSVVSKYTSTVSLAPNPVPLTVVGGPVVGLRVTTGLAAAAVAGISSCQRSISTTA